MTERMWVLDPDWRMLGKDELKRCRMVDGRPLRHCERRAVAEFRRKHENSWWPSWWGYCSEHLYGRRIKDGWVEVEVEADSPLALRQAQGT